MCSKFVGCVVGLVALTIVPRMALAQGGIGGVVRDTSGAVLPGVTVEASSPALIEQTRTAATDDRGQYLIVDLRPGTYTVTFTLAGFSTVRREGLTLSAGVTLPINADLQVGGIEETLTVSGETPVVDVQNVRQQAVLNSVIIEAIPRASNAVHLASALPGVVNSLRDVGGSNGEAAAGGVVSIHGSLGSDQVQNIDGMTVHDFTGGLARVNNTPMAEAAVQEYTFDISGASAETQNGGVRINTIPKEGGNTFRGVFYGNLTTSGMASTALSDELKTRWGLTKNDQIDRIWNFNPALGGPIARDRLWFFLSYKNWGTNKFPVDTYYDDGVTPGKYIEELWGAQGRLTWQANKRNKISVYYDYHGRWTPYMGISNLTTPEGNTNFRNPHPWVGQAKWSSPVTTRLLLEAGLSYTDQSIYAGPSPAVKPGAFPALEITTGKRTGNNAGNAFRPTNVISQTAAMTYVTGSHAIKVGYQHAHGHQYIFSVDHPPLLRFNNGVPFQVQLSAVPSFSRPALKHDLGIYAQDQWKMSRLTLNYGLRFDYLNAQIDEQDSPVGLYVPARHFDAIKDVPTWKDLSPRLGAVYDLFGNGKTAFKGSVNRYVTFSGQEFAVSVNPLTAGAGASDTRTWTDRNGDRIPQDDELGPSTNLNFGLPVFTVQPDEALREGWGVRQYNWEYSVAMQHEVVPGLSGTLGYYRRVFGNLRWTNNRAITPADFSPFTIVSPLNGETITMYNLNPAKRGQTNNVIEHAPDDKMVYDGVDLNMNGRFARGLTVTGGVTMGRTMTETCTVSDPNNLRFCKVKPPFHSQNVYKMFLVYPWRYGIQLSGVFQSTPGPVAGGFTSGVASILANYTVTSAIAGIPLTNGSITVPLLEPGTVQGDRMNRVDVRLSKSQMVGRVRAQGIFDLFNVFGVTPVNSLNNTYGPNWQRPTTVLQGRMAKVGVQLDF